MDKKNLILSLIFLTAMVYCIFSIVTKGFQSATVTGLVLFGFLSSAFFRRSKSR